MMRRKTRDRAADVLKTNSFLFTSKGEPVHTNIFSLNMILAGTGAAADDIFWEKYHMNKLQTDSDRTPDESDFAMRRQTITNYHSVISAYNTEVAKLVLKGILDSNTASDVRVFGMTDHSTIFSKASVTGGEELIGELPRLDLRRVKRELAKESGIEVSLSSEQREWRWDDEGAWSWCCSS